MARWAMAIDLDRCTACQACVVACQVENNVAPTGADQAELGRAISWMRLVPMRVEEGEGHLGPEPPPIDHQGINYAFIEKASVVLYWYEGQWLCLQGADQPPGARRPLKQAPKT